MKRLFVGIPITSEMVNGILLFQKEALRTSELRKLKTIFTETKNLHVTVEFLGNIPEKYFPGIAQIINKLAKNTVQFVLITKDITLMPQYKNSRMIWVVFHKNSLFDQLVRNIRKGIKKYFQQESVKISLPAIKVIIPHITLGRFKKPVSWRRSVLPFFSLPCKFTVKSLSLFESETLPEGPKYKILATFSLPKSSK